MLERRVELDQCLLVPAETKQQTSQCLLRRRKAFGPASDQHAQAIGGLFIEVSRLELAYEDPEQVGIIRVLQYQSTELVEGVL